MENSRCVCVGRSRGAPDHRLTDLLHHTARLAGLPHSRTSSMWAILWGIEQPLYRASTALRFAAVQTTKRAHAGWTGFWCTQKASFMQEGERASLRIRPGEGRGTGAGLA